MPPGSSGDITTDCGLCLTRRTENSMAVKVEEEEESIECSSLFSHPATVRQVLTKMVQVARRALTSGGCRHRDILILLSGMLGGLRKFLNIDRPEHHGIDRLKERGVEKGSGRHSTLQGRERSVFNQANIGTVSWAILGRLLRDGAGWGGGGGCSYGPFRVLWYHFELKLESKDFSLSVLFDFPVGVWFSDGESNEVVLGNIFRLDSLL